MQTRQPPKPQLPAQVAEPERRLVALQRAASLTWLGTWWRSETMGGHLMRGTWGRGFKIGGVIAAALVVLLVAVNLILSADWVEARIAARIKEQTGRDFAVDGSTLLLFTPSPHIVISDAKIADPDAPEGGAHLAISELRIDLNYGDLFSRRIDAERIVMLRPVLTVRLGREQHPIRWSGTDDPRQVIRFAYAQMTGAAPQAERAVRLKDMRIEDGAVVIIYDGDESDERRIEHVNATLSLPDVTAPLIGGGTLDWKDQTVDFSFEITTPADLRAQRPAQLQLAMETDAIAARFDGTLATAPDLVGRGTLSAKASSIPSVLAWMRETPAVSSAIGDGELASDVSWTRSEIALRNIRFALEHASGQGQAVVALQRPRPHLRAAFAIDHLDLNPFLAGQEQGEETSPGRAAPEPARTTPSERRPTRSGPARDWFSAPTEQAAPGGAAPPAPSLAEPLEIEAPSGAPADPAPVAPPPAAFDADVNFNIRKARVGDLNIGPTSLGLVFRNGLMEGRLGGMDLYGGHASGKLTIDAAKPIPTFTGNLRLDGVQAKPLLADAAAFGLISGRTKLNLNVSGAGDDADAIKSSLQGRGSFVVTEGAIGGIDITAFISALGRGDFDFRQGPDAETKFSDLGGSFVLANGIARTNNLQMVSPLLKVSAEGAVNITQSSIDILANPEIIAGPEGRGGANDFAGLTVPVRIEGPLADPRIQPQIGKVFVNPKNASRAVNKLGKALQKKFQGRPLGEALGRFLGNVQIGGGERQAPPQALAPADPEQGDADSRTDPEVEQILR